MKKISLLFFITIMLWQKGSGQFFTSENGGTCCRDGNGNSTAFHNYSAGSSITSGNGKYTLTMQSTGYLELVENTQYGPIKRWQFPKQGEGIPGAYLSLYARAGAYVTNPRTGQRLISGFIVWAAVGFGTQQEKIFAGPAESASFCTMNLLPDGSIGLFSYFMDERNFPFSYLAWASKTSEYEGGGSKILPSYKRDGSDFIIDPLFNDEYYTHYFAMGKISFPGTLVFQRKSLVKFSADTYVELLPGFETDITGNGGLSLEYLKHITSYGASPGEANSTNNLSGNIAANSSSQNNKSNTGLPAENGITKFSVAPNPTSGIVNIKLSNPEDRVQYVKVFDSNGKLVATYGAVTTINITKLTQGLYYYNIYTVKEGMHTGKLIKL